MSHSAEINVGPHGDALTFRVERFVMDGDRQRWHYTVRFLDTKNLVANDTDLSTPAHTSAYEALTALLGFASAAGDEHSGAGDLGFTSDAQSQFADILDWLSMAVEERENPTCARCGERLHIDGYQMADDEDGGQEGEPCWTEESGSFGCEWYTGHDENGTFLPPHDPDGDRTFEYDEKYHVHDDNYSDQCPDCADKRKQDQQNELLDYLRCEAGVADPDRHVSRITEILR